VGTTKRERHKQGRQQRLEAQVAALKRQRSRRRVQAIAILGVVLVVVTLLIAGVGGNDKKDDNVTAADKSSTTTAKASTTTTAKAESSTTTTGKASTTTTGAENATTAALRKKLAGGTPCPTGDVARKTSFPKPPQLCIDPAKTYTAAIVTNRGSFTVELDAEAAPITVNNFVFLARYHFYDGVTFHRIIPGFVVQGGDPEGTGMGGPGYKFEDELPKGKAPYYEIGSLAMANSGPDTNGSQFFIVTGEDGANLPPNYSRFGKVSAGMETVRTIEKTGSADGTPSSKTTITKVTVKES
jgi:cyclophilin family peptidyl-prolyl cis-trans isomerase